MVGSYDLYKLYFRVGDLNASLQTLIDADHYRIKHHVKWHAYLVASAFPEVYLALAEEATGTSRTGFLREAKGALKKSLRWAKVRGSILPEALRLQGVYDWLTGKQPSAQKHWQRSLAHAENMGMRHEVAMTHLEMGRRLSDQSHLRQAEAIFAEIGAEFDLAETRRLLPPLEEKKEA